MHRKNDQQGRNDFHLSAVAQEKLLLREAKHFFHNTTPMDLGKLGETDMEPIEPPWQAIKELILDDQPDLDWFNYPRNPQGEWASRPHEYESNDGYPDPGSCDQSPAWKPEEIQLDDGLTLVLEYT